MGRRVQGQDFRSSFGYKECRIRFPCGCVLAAGHAYEIALWRIVLRQTLHWIGPIVAVKILFMQHARGQMSTDAVALTTAKFGHAGAEPPMQTVKGSVLDRGHQRV